MTAENNKYHHTRGERRVHLLNTTKFLIATALLILLFPLLSSAYTYSPVVNCNASVWSSGCLGGSCGAQGEAFSDLNLVDCLHTGYSNSNDLQTWVADTNNSAWVIIGLNDTYSIHNITFFNVVYPSRTDRIPDEWSVSYSTDNSSWIPITGYYDNHAEQHNVTWLSPENFTGVAQYIKFSGINNTDSGDQLRVALIEIRGVQATSSPPNALTNLTPTQGEVIGGGYSYPITWTENGDPDGDNFTVHLDLVNASNSSDRDSLGTFDNGTEIYLFDFGTAWVDEGLYYIEYNATDVNGYSTVQQSGNFTVDKTNPTITWNSPASDNSTVYYELYNVSVNITGQDSNLYSVTFNVSTTSDFSSDVFWNLTSTNVNVTSYTLAQYMNLSLDTYYVRARVCDGHTSNSISDFYDGKDSLRSGMLFNDGNLLIYPASVQVDDYSVNALTDRYSFNYDLKNPSDTFTFMVASQLPITERDSRYMGHLVTGENWIDFESGALSVRIYDDEVSGYAYAKRIVLTYSKPLYTFKFSSVGELNCITQDKVFYISLLPKSLNWTGLTCAERYADNNLVVSFEGEPSHICTLRNNDLILEEDINCSMLNYNFTGIMGRNVLSMIDDNGSQYDCHVYMGKKEFGIGDFLYLCFWLLIVVFLIWLASKTGAKVLLMLGALVLAMFGFHLLVFHWLLSCAVMLGALFLFISAIFI